MKKSNLYLFFLSTIVLFSCHPEMDVPEASMGEINSSKVIAIGSNNASGYSNDGLNYEGQINNYAAIISEQMNLAGSVQFNQAFVSANSVGINSSLESKLVLGYKTDCKGVTSLSPVRSAGSGDVSIFASQYAAYGPFQNLSVPGLTSMTAIFPGYGNSANGVGNYNPYFSRMAANEATSSILSDALAQSPTFFTMMLGDNEILNYAKSGGTAGPIPPSSGPAGTGFDGSIELAISSLTGVGAQGIIANIPHVLDYPYFNTIPYNGLTVSSDDAATLNLLFNPYGINFVEGANPFIVEDASLPSGIRQLVPGELVLLNTPLDSVKCNGLGSIYPFRDEFVLSLDEISEINTKTDEYNSVIISMAQNYGVGIADVKGVVSSLKTGTVYNGVAMSSTFVTGGAYSLDGLQLNPIGQALIANAFIAAMNIKYNAAIPHANVTKYSGIIFP